MELTNYSTMKAQNEMEIPECSIEAGDEMARALVNILDLPDGILESILLSVTLIPDAESREEVVSMPQVRRLSSVCTKWRSALLSSCKRASCRCGEDADGALHELRSLRNVTHASVDEVFVDAGFLNVLATGFPLLTSFSLTFKGNHKVLDNLSSFLSLKVDIQELHLDFKYSRCFSYDDNSWPLYRKALEDLDFSKQVQLARLTLCYDKLSFPFGVLDDHCFPISPTLAQLASLRELCIRLGAPFAPLPLWLAEHPAFFGLRVDPFGSSLLLVPLMNSMRSSTRLRELSFLHVKYGLWEMDLASRLSHLTSLQLHWDDDFGFGAFCTQGLLLLSSTLRKLDMSCDAIPENARLLPLLEDLTLEVTRAIQPDYFAFTPNLRELRMTFTKEVAHPHLQYLARLTSLSLDLRDLSLNPRDSDNDAQIPEEPVWHICGAHTRRLQMLLLRTCKLLPLVDGLLNLDRNVAVSLRCRCERYDGPWYSSYAEYAAAQGGSPCRRLPLGSARQLFKDTRRPVLGPPAPGPCSMCPFTSSRGMDVT
eukprot:jgi/Mesen1/5999/ME000304S05007